MAKENEVHGEVENNHEASSTYSSEVTQQLWRGENIGSHQSDGEKTKENKNTVPFYRLFAFADSTDVCLMILGSVGAVANGAALPLMTLLFGKMIQSFGGAEDTHDVVGRVSKVALEFIYLAIGSGAASFLQVACWMATGERQTARIRNLFLKTLLGQEIAFFDMETNTGKVIGRMSGDTILIQDAMGEKVGKFVQLMSTFFAAFIVAFIQGWLLSLVMLSIIPPFMVAGALMSIVVSKMASKGQKSYGAASAVVEQTIGSIRMVASFTGERISMNKYKKALKNAYSSTINDGLATGLGMGFVMFFMFCGYSLGVWYGGKLILDEGKGYTGGDVISVIFAILAGSFSLGQASTCMTAFASGRVAAYNIFESISRKSNIDAYNTSAKKLENFHGDIEFVDVYFSYPTRPGEQILKGLFLLITSGTTVALVGESGSGKSSVLNLIERFYDPQHGQVLIDGTNIKDLQVSWLRSKIGLVSQEPVLFTSSIKDNISYGKENATTEEIKAAIELANASNFIDKFPEGLNTMVGEHGTQLSGGQKQRIAIARAILKDPKILLLDEATSALDSESEQVVQQALVRVMLNRTTVIVAHRLSAVRSADTIFVIHRGSVVEKGSHTELNKYQDSAYSQLIRLQEMNPNSYQLSQYDNENSILSLDGATSRKQSFGHSSRHLSVSARLVLPGGSDFLESALEAPNTPNTKQSNKVPLSRLASLNKPELLILLLGAASAILNGAIFPVYGVLLSNVTNSFYETPQKLKKDTKFWSSIFLLFGVLSLAVLPAGSYFFGLAGARLVRRIRLMTFEKILNMEIAWFDEPNNSSGAVGARLLADAAAVRSLVGDALALIVQNITTLVGGLVIAFISNWQLSFIILSLIPLMGLNGWLQMKFMKGFSGNTKMMYEEASQVVSDAVGSIRTVASFSAEEKVVELYKKKCEGPMTAGIRQAVISGIGFGFSNFLLFCVYATCFYAAALLVKDGKTTFHEVFRVFFALAMSAMGISQASSLVPDSSKAKSATASVFSILDRKSKIDPSNDSGMTLDTLQGNIEFRNVSFKYLNRPDVQIFQDLCLVIKSGKTVALVGESGSGKSTVISLLQRFYDPDSGHILLDGIELQKFKPRWLRKQMGLVSQEPVLFNDSIRANIAFGKEGEATEAEILAATEAANAHMFICSLQQGYDTIVGERGIQLSGGQKQRIAISRAIVKDPRILLLDEATSALDAESERVVQDALDRVMINRTSIVVAHRLSTIKGANLIAVLKNGVIIEKGNHRTLINIQDGAYASLVALHSSSTTS